MNFKHIFKDKKTAFLLMFTLFWMGVIFFFSSQPGGESSLVSGTVKKLAVDFLEWAFNGHPPELINSIIQNGDHIVRKSGHVLEYAILGILVISLACRLRFNRCFLLSAFVCFLYAASDEFHQVFVPGRGPMASDVMLDTAAALCGIGLVLLKKRLHRPQSFPK